MPENAGFIRRLFATITDSLVFNALFLLPATIYALTLEKKYTVDYLGKVDSTDLIYLGAWLLIGLFLCGIARLCTEILLTKNMGGSFGKLLWGLRVSDTENNPLSMRVSFFRAVAGKMFSMSFFGLGYLNVIRHKEKKAFHDLLFNTKVTKDGFYLPGIGAVVISLGIIIWELVVLANMIGILFTLINK